MFLVHKCFSLIFFCPRILRLFKLKTEGKTICRKSQCKVTKLKLKFSLKLDSYKGSETWVLFSAFYFFPPSVTNRFLVSKVHEEPVPQGV